MAIDFRRRCVRYSRRASFTACLALASCTPITARAADASHRSGHLASACVLGPMSGAQTMKLAVALPPRNQPQLDDLVRRLYDKTDPLYGRYLTSDEFSARFAPTSEQYEAFVSYFQSRGYQVTGRHANHLLLDVEAPANIVESTFGVKLGRYRAPNGHAFYSADREPNLPSVAGVKIAGVAGLDSAIALRPHSSMTTPMMQSLATPSPIGSGFAGGLSPSDIKTAYSLNMVSQTGAGQTLALLALDGGYASSDVVAYETAYGLPNVPLQNVLVDGVSGAPGTGALETVMGIEMQAALAPNAAKIMVYEGPNTAQGIIDTYNKIATDNIAKSVCSSWGLPEADGNQAFRDAENTIFQQMAAQGQSFFAAAGDIGAYDDGSTLSVDDPASQPYVTGVGGTTLAISSNAYAGESAWNDSSDGLAGGGGISAFWIKPSYQTGFGVSSTMRNVPDVSLNADVRTGYSIYYGGGWAIVGGTSASAPLWSAFAALVNEKRAANGLGTLGFVNPQLYAIAGTAYASNFHDIFDNSTNFYYSAAAGYDNATGLGSLIGDALLSSLAAGSGAVNPGAPTGVSSGPPTITQPTNGNAAHIPTNPQNVTAVGGSGQVVLSWSLASFPESYVVRRSTDNQSYTSIATLNSTTSTYTDTSVSNGVTYYYRISGQTIMISPGSVAVSATPMLGVPTGLAATAGIGRVSLGWSPVFSATGYHVKRSTVSGSGYTNIAVSGDAGYVDTSVTPGVTYYYVVSAMDATSESGNSATASAVPLHTPPSAPMGVKAVGGTSQVALSWSASSGATSYSVKRSTSSGSGYESIGVTSGTACTDSTVVNGTTYYYVVTASNDGGESGNSAQASATPSAGPPSAPTGLTATAGTAQVALAWSASSSATSYSVKRAATSSGAYTTLTTTSGTNYLDTTVTNGTTYYYVVSAANTHGDSANSTQASATPHIAIAGAPSGLSITPGNQTASLTWGAVTGAAHYNVKRSVSRGGPYTTVGANVVANSFVDSGLTNGATYYYVVSSLNTAGESANSTEGSVTLIVPTTYTVKWVSRTAGTSVVKYGTSASALSTTVTDNTLVTQHSVTLSGLSGHTTYYYQASSTSGGVTTTSATASFTTN